MKTTAKRLLSLLLCAVMWFSCLGTAGVTAIEDGHDHDHDHDVGEVSATAANEAVPTALGTEEVTITVKRDPADGSFDSGHYCLAPIVSVKASAGHTIDSVTMNGETVKDYESFKPTDDMAYKNITVKVTYDGDKTESESFSFGHELRGRFDFSYKNGSCVVEYKFYGCKKCGGFCMEYCSGYTHNFVKVKTVASCDGKSYELLKCTGCGMYSGKPINVGNPPEAKEHAWKTVSDPTPECGSFAVKVEECENCGDVRATVVLGKHTYDDKGTVTDPTCTEKGKRVAVCTTCGESQTYTVDALGHNYDKGTVTKVADCQNEGEKTYTCSRCGAKRTEATPKGEHKYIPGDCTEGIKCSVCQKVVIEATTGHNMTYIPAGIEGHIHYCQNKYCEESESEPHKFTSSSDPTTGNTFLYCSVCGFQTTEHTHEFGGWTPSADGKYHERTCKTCGTVEKASHTPEADDGDCTTEVKCKVCGGIAVEARSEHEFTEVDYKQRDDNGHRLKCKYCSVFGDVVKHTPEADDGDCTTAVRCTVCLWEVVKPQSHVDGELMSDKDGHWFVCGHEGCTQVSSQKHPHISNGVKDCKDAEECIACHYVMRKAGEHDWEIVQDNKNGTTHKVRCKLCKKEDNISHEFADDGNCTTADKCACGAESTPKKSHDFTNWTDAGAAGHTRTCQNDGCNYSETENHNVTNISGDCTKPFECTVCHHKSQGYKTHSLSEKPTEEGKGHVYTCTNEGCNFKSEIADHVAKDRKYCTEDVVCKFCGAVMEKGETEHHLISTTDTTRVDISKKHEVRCDNPGCSYIEGWEEHKSNHANETDCTKDSICEDCKCVLVKGGEHPSFKVVGTADGHVRTCTVCGHSEGLKPHEKPKKYDCTKETKCFICGYVIADPRNPEHKLVAVNDGNDTTHLMKCSDCDYETRDKHTYDPDRKWDEDLVCTKCGYVKEKADEHKWGTAADNGDGTHVYKCEVCGLTRYEAHSGGKATCTKKAVCEACGVEYGSVDKTNHTGISDVWKSDGTNHWKECSACGEKVELAAHKGGEATCAKKAVCEVCKSEYGSLDKTNHTGISDVWKHDGTNHWKECSACGEKVGLEPHTYKNGNCLICGAVDESYNPPATTDPSDTTTEPSDTTAEPSDTTAEPTDTTAEPTDTTAEPTDTTAEPTDTTAKPSDTTAEPTDTTAEPTDTTAEPSDTTGSDKPPKTGDRDGALYIVLFAVSMVGAAVVATGVITSRRKEDR